MKDLINDMTQAALMWKLRVKIDVWSKGVDETLRQRNRKLLIEAYLQLPPCRVWLFSKHIRLAFERKATELEDKSEPYDETELCVHGPEDTIAEGKCLFTVYADDINFTAACSIIRPEKLARLIYTTTINDIMIKERRGVSLWAGTTFDAQGFLQVMAQKFLAFIGPGMPTHLSTHTLCLTIRGGKISDCGRRIRKSSQRCSQF